MKLFQSLLIISFFISAVHAHEQPHRATKFAGAKKSITALKQFATDNEKTLKNSAKVLAVLLLANGLYKVGRDQFKIIYPRSIKQLIFPQAYQANGNMYDLVDITRPPYFVALAIAAYLLDADFGLYQTIGNYVQQYFALNDHVLNIIKNLTKISGATLLMYGHYLLAMDYIFILPKDGYNSHASIKKHLKALWAPEVMYDRVDEDNRVKSAPMARPPYLPALGISAYLAGSGIYGIYKEVKELLDESQQKKVRSKAPLQPQA